MGHYDDSEDNDIRELAEQFTRDFDAGRRLFLGRDDFEDIINYFFDIGDMNQAEKAIKKGTETYPDDAYLQLQYVKYHAMMMDYNAAQKKLEYVEKNFEPVPDLYVEKVLVYQALNQPIDAISALNKALSMDEKYPEAHMLLVQEYLLDQNIEKAVEHAMRSIQLDETFVDDIGMINIDFLYPKFQKKDLLVNFFTRMTEEYPMYPSLWGGLGLAYMNASEYEHAVDAFLFQLSLDESDFIVHINIADAYYSMGDNVNAIQHYLKANEKTDIPSLDLNIGRCYFNMGDYESAMSFFILAQNREELFNMATGDIVRTFRVQGKFDEARAFLRNMVKDNPQNMNAVEELLPLLDPERDTEEIKDLCFMAFHNEDYPKYGFLHNFVQFCCENGGYDLGIDVCLEYLDDPDIDTTVMYALAAFYLKKGHVQQACNYLERALIAAPDDSYSDFEELDARFVDVPEVMELLSRYTNF
ncbi:MAG: tetratricopeptide repeat protein [Bacteroidales bacterium]|nr:tetratricopeptide repeat protein [Bacteroidales bacterium]